MLIDRRAKAVLKKLNKNGVNGFIVGGAVRDFLLNKKPQDYDICHSSTPEKIKEIFKTCKIYETGIKYGTLTLNYKGLFIEITPFRVENGYSDNRHPDNIEFVKNIEQDLSRRDFTINALALNHKGEIIDLYGGEADLKSGIIKAVGNPHERFTEDPLRILRGYRFAARFGFSIEEKTKAAIKNKKEGLASLSKERLSKELKLILSGNNLSAVFLELLDTLSVFGVAKTQDNTGFLQLLKGAKDPLKFPLFVSFYNLKNALSLSNKEEKIIDNFTLALNSRTLDILDLFLNKSWEETEQILWLLKAQNRLTHNDEIFLKTIFKKRLYKQISRLKINGNDLMALGFKGQQITKIKQDISREILLSNLKNNRKKILNFIKNNY